MIHSIQTTLANLEIDHDIKILYACEAGSRSWGWHSPDSDYDVRFIYIHKLEHYLSIDPVGIGRKRDTILANANRQVDLAGWEMAKALRLFRKGNASLLEWLYAEEVYKSPSPAVAQLKGLSSRHFQPLPCLHHYLKMADGNYREWKKRDDVELKAVLNTIRPALSARSVERSQAFPPLELQTLLEQTVIDPSIKEEMEAVLTRKKAGEKWALQQQLGHIRRFLDAELPSLHGAAGKMAAVPPIPTEVLDCLFRKALEEAWR